MEEKYHLVRFGYVTNSKESIMIETYSKFISLANTTREYVRKYMILQISKRAKEGTYAGVHGITNVKCTKSERNMVKPKRYGFDYV